MNGKSVPYVFILQIFDEIFAKSLNASNLGSFHFHSSIFKVPSQIYKIKFKRHQPLLSLNAFWRVLRFLFSVETQIFIWNHATFWKTEQISFWTIWPENQSHSNYWKKPLFSFEIGNLKSIFRFSDWKISKIITLYSWATTQLHSVVEQKLPEQKQSSKKNREIKTDKNYLTYIAVGVSWNDLKFKNQKAKWSEKAFGTDSGFDLEFRFSRKNKTF